MAVDPHETCLVCRSQVPAAEVFAANDSPLQAVDVTVNLDAGSQVWCWNHFAVVWCTACALLRCNCNSQTCCRPSRLCLHVAASCFHTSPSAAICFPIHAQQCEVSCH